MIKEMFGEIEGLMQLSTREKIPPLVRSLIVLPLKEPRF